MHSEVARLRRQIMAEYESMKHGFSGLASGAAKHAFIEARLRRVDGYHEQLVGHIGEQEATATICDLYIQTMG